MNRLRKYKPPLRWVLPGKLYRKIEPTLRDVTVISYPKCGRTWHRAMLGHYMVTGYNPFIPKREMRYFLHLAHKTFGQRHAWTHNGTEFGNPLLPDDPKFCAAEDWQDKRVLLITREIKDILVSSYYQARFRTNVTDLEISDFVRSPEWGVDKILGAFERWDALSARTRAFEHITYEELHADPVDALRRTIELFGTVAFDEERARSAVEATRFEQMKKREEAATNSSPDDKDAHKRLKVRSGKVGSYTDDLDQSDIDWIDSRIKEIGNPFASPAPQ